MNISFSSSALKYLHDVKKKNPKLAIKIQQKLALFQDNPKHPSLRTHKLAGDLSNSWSISIEENIRMLYYVKKDGIVFFLIGMHDEVYRK